MEPKKLFLNIETVIEKYDFTDDQKNALVAYAKTFGGVPHRIEFVRELEGVKYYNSSIDSQDYDSHLLNLRAGYRIFKDRKGIISINMFDLLYDADRDFIAAAQNSQYIRKVRDNAGVHKKYVTLSFEYKFNSKQ